MPVNALMLFCIPKYMLAAATHMHLRKVEGEAWLRLSFWEPVEGMEDGKDENTVQPPKGTHSTLVNPGVRDD